MPTYDFTLIVQGPDLQDEANSEALYAAGCDDATVGRIGDVQHLDFTREAETFADAVFSALAAIESSVPGAEVVHLEPDEFVTMAEIAQRTGRTRESVRLLTSGQRGPGGFPAPATHLKTRHRMWRWPEVARWFGSVLGQRPEGAADLDLYRFVTAFNAGLELRRTEPHLEPDERLRICRLISSDRNPGAVT